MIALCIAIVLREGRRKIMSSGEVLFGTHVYVWVRCAVEQCVDGRLLCYADGSGGQSLHAVGIVGRFYL